jgi:hypothetical protein
VDKDIYAYADQYIFVLYGTWERLQVEVE